MDKEKVAIDNGSYFYKLNQELSGQTSITPYFMEQGMASQAIPMGEVREGEMEGSVDQEQNLG